MNKPDIPERIASMKKALNIEHDSAFGEAAGMSKSVVNQLLSGKMKSIAARYAYLLQDKYGFNARWIMMGEGPMMHDTYPKKIETGILLMQEMPDYVLEEAIKSLDSLAKLSRHTSTQKK